MTRPPLYSGPVRRVAPRPGLALLVATEHHRVGGRVEIEPDHIPESRIEIGIVQSLKVLTMWDFSSLRNQMRCTELGEMPTWRPMLCTLHPRAGRPLQLLPATAII